MADQETLDEIQTASLIIQVDGARAAGDPFKLSASLLSLMTTRLADTKGKNAAADLMAASTVGAADTSAPAQGAAMIANGGSRQTLIKQRNDSRDQLHDANARVRSFYSSASDDGESTPELAKINMQPKRAPGQAQGQAKPDAPGAVSYNTGTRDATIAAMPAHASFVRLYRQPAGGQPELAGVSSTTTVSAVQFGPATATVNYAAWLVGVNSRGEGPPSAKFNFTG